jgi:hypothetical protein
MEKMEFFGQAMDEILEQMPEEMKKGTTLSMNTVVKLNDIELHGVSIKKEGVDMAPNIYLDEYYDRFQQGEPMDKLMKEVVDIYAGLKQPEIVTSDIPLEYDSIKDKLALRLIELKRNRNYLANVPYMSVGNGLALVCDVKLRNDESGMWRTTITKDMVEKFGYDKREIFDQALNNVWDVDPPVLVDMEGQLMGNGDDRNLLNYYGRIDEKDKSSMYVLSNESGVLGAAALYYPKVQEQISDMLNEGYFVIPSSLHEVIIVPDSAGMDAKVLDNMVKDANRSVVQDKDVLSDNVFHFDRDAMALTTPMAQEHAREQAAEMRS